MTLLENLSASELEAIAAEPYEPRGIIHSEMALIIDTIRRLGVEVIIESGRARGQSTYMLAKYLPSRTIHSVELRDDADARYGIERCSKLPNVVLHSGDGSQLLPALARAVAPRRTAVICDGPKGMRAIDVVEKCFDLPSVVVGFIHDMRPLDQRRPAEHRPAAEQRLPRHWFSDDPRYVAETMWLDRNVREVGGPCGPAWQAEMGAYGPTVGAFFNPNIN